MPDARKDNTPGALVRARGAVLGAWGLAAGGAISDRIARHQGLFPPVACVLLLVVLLVPVPPVVMDVLLCVNIALAMLILLTAVSMKHALEFSVFPALLLGTTLVRLVLNIGTTRLILGTDAATPEEAAAAAGRVVMTFGRFVAGDNLAVGVVIFVILVVVQFVVITKGATRVAEVAARFTLDGMPGKQAAIDSDLAGGAIDQPEAKRRREQLAREAEFFGAMDGASKFVRGDAVAGLVITVVNILGGMGVGLLSRGWSLPETAAVFTKLTIGDGLAAQLPAFMIAIAAALIVTRCGSTEDVGRQATTQISAHPGALLGTAGFLALLTLTPLPSVPLLGVAGALAFWGAMSLRAGRLVRGTETASGSDDGVMGTAVLEATHAMSEDHASKGRRPVVIEPMLAMETLEVELGLGLLLLAEANGNGSGGGLLERIGEERRAIAEELGLLVPSIRVRDNARLRRHEYAIKLRGSVVGAGVARPGRSLATAAGGASEVSGPVAGEATHDPATGADAWWIDPADYAHAVELGYAVVEPAQAVAAHVARVVRSHADELLTREHVEDLLDALRERAPRLVSETVPRVVPVTVLQGVLQGLARERVPIRDLETILETIARWVDSTQDPAVLREYARNALRRTICGQYARRAAGGANTLRCVVLSPELESTLEGFVQSGGAAGPTLVMSPTRLHALVVAVDRAICGAFDAGQRAVLVTGPTLRAAVFGAISHALPGVAVLGNNEMVPEVVVEVLASVGSVGGVGSTPGTGTQGKPAKKRAGVEPAAEEILDAARA